MTLALFAHGKTARIVHGDALKVLRRLPDNGADSIVTDPPSGIKFMGIAWDANRGGRDRWVEWLASIMTECLRVLKPGGHSLTWALPRTSHWTAYAIENAGFEIRDRVTHLFGEGMPKSPHVLKPAAEDWWLARKPFRGTAAANIAAHGTGGLNVEACRLDTVAEPFGNGTARSGGILGESTPRGRWEPDPNVGRWPAHVTLDSEAAKILDEQSGTLRSGAFPQQRTGIGYAGREGYENAGTTGIRRETDFGGASRFFYCAKADESEKTEGGTVDNDHETVKPAALMRWLIRLVTPPGGLVLDPFTGSGTTGVACAAEGMSFFGIEERKKHHRTAQRRLERWFGAVSTEVK